MFDKIILNGVAEVIRETKEADTHFKSSSEHIKNAREKLRMKSNAFNYGLHNFNKK